MSTRVIAYCLIVVLSTCIDEGNGNWKQNRENLQKDIVIFKEMVEKIEDEIEDFYEQYSDKWPKDEYPTDEDENTYKLPQNKDNSVLVTIINVNVTNNFSKGGIPPLQKEAIATSKNDFMKEISSTEQAIIASKWPKFEDILLEMGKKYDWKNDRWIKVKKKASYSNEQNQHEENHLISHDRHKFRYKTVKLNRGKSRRNVVIAVTAVR